MDFSEVAVCDRMEQARLDVLKQARLLGSYAARVT